MTPKLQFNDVRFCYGEVCALEAMRFSIMPNTLTALIGPNGGGKSTLIKLISGILHPEAGSIHIDDRCGIGYVAQAPDFDIDFPVTVRELVLMGTLPCSIRPFVRYSAVQRHIAEQAMERVQITDLARRGAGQLSGGQLKRAMIARALASGSEVIVLDEPDAGLDIDAAAELYRVLDMLKTDKTIIAASHHIDAILGIADSALYIRKTAVEYDPKDLQSKLKEGLLI